MSLDQQVALTRPTRGESSHLSRAARQVVPPFLQKLYEIVNDPKNDELIRWSENGDSFYVLNHERFAREVLGRWFKHQKFTSFVRQLNMYGFHKIPHLQQGVLKSDTDTEPWNFEHPHFHRGQPDLLCLIQRKKQPANANADEAELADPIHPSSPIGHNAGQVLDVHSLVNGIAAIKRHQQAISADLNALKKSNDLLWEEATLTRQRHDKHQDTINRILKFLAGVFGHSSDTIHKDDGGRSPNVVPRPRQRLMIGDGRFPRGKTVEITDVDDDDDDGGVHAVHPQEGANIPLAGQLSVESQTPAMSPIPPTTPSEALSPLSLDSAALGYSPRPATRPTEVLSRASTGNNSNHTPTTEVPPRTTTAAMNVPRTDTLSPSLLASNTINGNDSALPDHMWQAAIQQVLNNPSQMQRLMQALASQQNYPIAAPSDPGSFAPQSPAAQLAPYNPAYNEYSRYRSDLPVSAPIPQTPLPLLSTSMQHSDDVPSLEPLLENASRLQKQYRDAVEIEADMDVLQSSLNSLIHDLGMDPQALMVQGQDRGSGGSVAGGVNGVHANGVHPNGMSSNGIQLNGMHTDQSLLPSIDQHHDDSNSDSFLESLLNGMSASDPNVDYTDVTNHYDPSARIDGTSVGDASTEQLTAFLDEVSDTAPSPLTHSPDIKPASQKRKSDVAGLSIPFTNPVENAGAGPKTKRKR